ncbi:uncharacterized protein LOC134528553 [Bacillus rossius redtenbacheri]|uniref:uncharacterized protein LOC134528553 n=1 Tax=Bacillus rossius redtenbacheri TaxID=93214 RepID=UPI002FDCB94C
MSEYASELRLAVLYLAGALLAVVATVSAAVPSLHWREILDNCVDARCGCVLHGAYTVVYFNGGRNAICHFAVLASLPAAVVGLVMSGYHGYRVCISAHKTSGRSAGYRNGRPATAQPASREPKVKPPACRCWVLLAVLAALNTLLLFAVAVTLSHGYHTTCSQYRHQLARTLPAVGLSARAVHERLPCSAVLDFMDFLEPTTRPFRRRHDVDYSRPHEEVGPSRGGFIHTATALLLAACSAWANTAVWALVTALNVALERLARTN